MKDKINKALAGKKSYLTAALLIVLGIAQALGYAEIPQEVREGLLTILTGAGVAFLRAGVKKVETKAAP